jgi:hypothetical protein
MLHMLQTLGKIYLTFSTFKNNVRNVCLDCGSRRTTEIEMVTHSCSRERAEFIFRSLLPPIPGKTVVDVGSRLGAVLYGILKILFPRL